MSGSNQTWEIPSGEWNCKSSLGTPTPTSRSLSPQSRVGEAIFNNYLELINSKSNLSAEEIKQAERLERPFDFFDDEEFAFGINLLNNNVVCVGDNITKLIQLAQEPWPDNVKLFQPYEVEQILLPDNASCLAVQAFLKMCNLPFEVEMRWNAEFMSPSGRVPFIKCGAFVVSELEPIAQFAANKGVSLCSRLSTEEKAEMRAYMSLITNVLVNAELYISWLDNDTFNQVTKVRNSSVYPWPLGWLQTRTKRNAVAKRLKALHWHDKTLEQVLADVEQCCNSLSQRLGDKDYFFGSPTPLDALIYGHIRALLSAQGPKAALMIRPITSALLHHVIRITSFVGIKLTPQEEYLLRQAFTIRRPSPTRTISSERSSRARRSKLSIKHQSRDSLNKDMFGFKPFASKKIIIMTSKEGVITCKYDEMGRYGNCSCIDEEEYNLIIEVIEDIIDKVEETVIEKFNKNVDAENDKHDFEVIAFPHQLDLLKNESLSRLDELLEPLEENDITDVTDISIEELIQMTDDDNDHVANNNDHIGDSNDHIDDNNDHIGDNNDLNNNDLNNSDLNNNDLDSDGLINEKHLASENTITNVQPNEASPSPGSNEPFPSSLTDSSNNVHMREDDGLTTITSSGDRPSAKDLTTKSSSSSRFSSDSKVTLKMFNDEQISVESLLNYLRKRNAAYNLIMPDAADVD